MDGEFAEDLEWIDVHMKDADKLCPFMDTLRKLGLMHDYEWHVVEHLVAERDDTAPYSMYSVKMVRVFA
jgi:hypothetical protein